MLALALLCHACKNPNNNGISPKNYAAENNISDTAPDDERFPGEIKRAYDSYLLGITQIYQVPSNRSTLLTAKGGMKINIHPSSLETEKGDPVSGNITVKIAELTNAESMFRANAVTLSNGRLLASGGSYFIDMESNGKQLRIKKGHSLSASFPKLAKNEMELFYGNRNDNKELNWRPAGQSLEISQSYASYNPPFPDSVFKKYKSKIRTFDSLNSRVYYENRFMTVSQMMGIFKKKGIQRFIDTVFIPVKFCMEGNCGYAACKKTEMYKFYRIISQQELKNEKDSLSAIERYNAKMTAENNRYKEEWNRQFNGPGLSEQLQQYYAPASISILGWINVDKFYEKPSIPETPLQLPFTLNNMPVRYFIIYKSFTGYVNGYTEIKNNGIHVLRNLPSGERIIFISFIKSGKSYYHCREDFITGKEKVLKPEFKVISRKELLSIFGKNVKT